LVTGNLYSAQDAAEKLELAAGLLGSIDHHRATKVAKYLDNRTPGLTLPCAARRRADAPCTRISILVDFDRFRILSRGDYYPFSANIRSTSFNADGGRAVCARAELALRNHAEQIPNCWERPKRWVCALQFAGCIV
jgi:hypothetical protein